jgi:hypothetical protein
MSKPLAIGLLSIFAVMGLGATWLGWSEFAALRLGTALCTTPMAVDQTTFWLLGAAAIAVFPFLGLTSDVRHHHFMFGGVIAWVLGVPISAYVYFLLEAAAQGYELPAIAYVLLSAEYQLTSLDCRAQGSMTIPRTS